MGYMDLAKSYSNQMRVVEAPASGGGLSQNGKFSYGYASSCGKRSSMEDFFETRIDGIDGEIVGLFGVFDGHGGARAAEYVKRHLFSNLITHPKFISDTKSAITDAYNHTDSELLKSEENSHNRDAGSTASTAILVGDRLVVANVGDSRAVICRGGNAFAVSRDHKPDQSDERERIENAGGFVMWAGTWRVGGVLAVSRAFGDRLLKQYVVADPEIQEEKIDDSLEFLILASDGLWDVFSNEEAVAVVKEVEEPEESTKKLVGEAIKRGSADNITCVVVRFLESKSADNNASQESSKHASSSSQETKHDETEVRKDSDHKISTKETKQDRTAVQSDLDCNIESEKLKQKSIAATSNLNRNTESENLNQMLNAARSNDSGHISSTQKPIAARSIDSGHISSTQKPTAARSNNSGHISSAQKPTAARSNDSGQISSTQRPVAITATERRISSEQSDSASQKNQMPIAISSGSKPMSSAKQSGQAHNEMPIAISSGSEAKSSAKQPGHAHNEMPIAIHSGSEAKSSVKVPGQGKITSDNDLDSSIENQKLNIAAKHATPSEQIAIHSDSEAKISAKVPGQAHKLDSSIANQKQKIAATHNTSSEQSGSTGEKNRKPIATHSETTTSKASSVHSNAN